MGAKKITDASFASDVLEAKGFVMIDFWAEWCGPCRQLGPIVDEVAAEMKNVTICKMNVDENPETPSRLGVRGIPALFLFQDGKMISTKVGSMPKSSLVEWLNSEIA